MQMDAPASVLPYVLLPAPLTYLTNSYLILQGYRSVHLVWLGAPPRTSIPYLRISWLEGVPLVLDELASYRLPPSFVQEDTCCIFLRPFSST